MMKIVGASMCRAGRAIRSTAPFPIKRLLEIGRGISVLGGRWFLTAAHCLLRVGLPLLIPCARCMALTGELLALHVHVPAPLELMQPFFYSIKAFAKDLHQTSSHLES